MLALSVRQPWADLIIGGEKTEEYRSSPTKVRGRVWIYASKTVDKEAMQGLVIPDDGEFPTGVIIGSVEVTDCEWDPDNEEFIWSLAKPERCAPTPVSKRANPVWFHPW